jgi:hypothetical protein
MNWIHREKTNLSQVKLLYSMYHETPELHYHEDLLLYVNKQVQTSVEWFFDFLNNCYFR